MSQSNLIVLTNNINFHKELINTCNESIKSKEEQCEVLRKLFSNLQDEIIKEKSTISMINEKLNILLKEQEELETKQAEVVVEVVVEEVVEETNPKKCWYTVKNRAYACTDYQYKRMEAYKKWKPFLTRNAKKYKCYEKLNNWLIGITKTEDKEIFCEGIYNNIEGKIFYNHNRREGLFGYAENSKHFHKVDEICRDFDFNGGW